MSLDRWMTAEMSTRIRAGEVMLGGGRMRYLQAGAGPDLLMLHGLLGTANTWRPVLGALGIHSTVYANDALNIGESERIEGLDASLEATADRTAAFMDAVGIASADVVGTSHGGAVAMMLAARHPSRVRSLVLHAPANPYSSVADPLIRFYCTPLGRWFADRVPTMPRSLQNVALGRMYNDATSIGDGVLDAFIASLRKPGTIPHILRILAGWNEDMRSLSAAVRKIGTIPVQLLWGAEDRAVSLKSAHRLHSMLPGAELMTMPNAGHLPYQERPDFFVALANSFILRGRGFARERFSAA